uniref:Uncharacterized protein n=1 Tax=Chrysemys picta bellii TaxID=8478 RepID=A0A8C3F7B5_CHRPI
MNKERRLSSRRARPAGQGCAPSYSICAEIPRHIGVEFKGAGHDFSSLLREYLPTKLANVTYEPAKCASLTLALSEEIKHLVKQVTPPRYKLVVNVTIGNKSKDETVDIVVTSRCLWDPHSDNFTSSQYVNETLFCVVLVHAVYFE